MKKGHITLKSQTSIGEDSLSCCLSNIDIDFIQDYEKQANKINPKMIDIDNLPLIIQSLKDLLDIIKFVRQEKKKLEEQAAEYEQLRFKISNHYSIMESMEKMYENRIMQLNVQRQQKVQEIQRQKEQLLRDLDLIRQESAQLKNNIQQAMSESAKQQLQIQQLTRDKQHLHVELDKAREELKKYHNIINEEQTSQVHNSKQILQGQLLHLILPYLSLKDCLTLKCLSHKTNYIIKHSSKCIDIINAQVLKEATRKTKDIQKEYRQYENLFQIFTQDNVREWALRYLYFKLRPGDYLSEIIVDFHEYFQHEPEKERKKSFFGSLIGTKDDGKISLKQLAEEKCVKKLQQRLQEYFAGTINIINTNCLQDFRETMSSQLKQLKQTLREGKPTQNIATTTKFLYIQSQNLLRLSQTLFGQLLHQMSANRQLLSSMEDLKESVDANREVLSKMFQQKLKLQQSNWKMQAQYTRYKHENTRLHHSLQSSESQLHKVRQDYNNLLTVQRESEKKTEEMSKRVKSYQEQLETIGALLMKS